MVNPVTIFSVLHVISSFIFSTAAPTRPSITHCKTIANVTVIISKSTIHGLKLSTYNTTVGTVVDISCLDDDYVLNGASQLTCLSSGQWDNAVPNCSIQKIVPKNYNLIIGLCAGGGGLLITILVIIIVLRVRRRNKKPTQNVERRFKNTQKTVYAEEMRTRYSQQETSLAAPPNVYKVWSFDRSLKKFITAFNFDDLKQKASKTFGVEDVCVVLEEDGTEIEDDTALEACKDRTLQVLSITQLWAKDSTSGNGFIRLERSTDENDSGIGTVRSYRL